jgi:2'-5' RNA ligase
MQGEKLSSIAQKIDEDLSKVGFKKEKRKFSPHLTIARVRSAKNKEKLLRIIEKYTDTKFAEINVNSIKLKKSVLTEKGPIYTNLKDIRL